MAAEGTQQLPPRPIVYANAKQAVLVRDPDGQSSTVGSLIAIMTGMEPMRIRSISSPSTPRS